MVRETWVQSHIASYCDTMWVDRQTDDPFVCLGAKPNKGLGLEISDRKWGRKGSWQRNQGKVSWRGETQRGRRTEQRDQSRWVSRRKQWGKTSQDELAFLVALKKFREKYTPSDSLRNARKAVQKKCHKTSLLALATDLSPYCSFVLFFSHSLGCISCGRKEMCDTPVGTH